MAGTYRRAGLLSPGDSQTTERKEMAKHLIANHSGHDVIEFDKADPEQLAAADARFRQLVSEQKHVAATRPAGGGPYTKIDRPEQQQDETLFHRQLVGG